MKKVKILCAAGFVAVFAALWVLPMFTTGCTTTQVGTNTVTVIDTNKLAYVDATVGSVASGIFRRAIQRSPEHAAEISTYVRAAGGVFCTVKASGQFSPDLLVTAVDAATIGLQQNVPPEVIDGKNALTGLYRVLWNDQLTVTVPNNGWPSAVVSVICDAIDRSLVDAGQPGFRRR